MVDINRRRLLKTIGVATGASAIGVGNIQGSTGTESVSESKVKNVVQRAEAKVALETAGVDSASLRVGRATKEDVNSSPWIEVPVDDAKTEPLFYNLEEEIAEMKTGENTLVRAKPDEGEIFVEHLKMGEEVTAEALATLEDNTDYADALRDAEVVAVNTDGAAAHVDYESGIARAFIPAEFENDDERLLLVEINENDSLKAIYGFPSESEAQTMGIDCWANCITIGANCRFVCGPCTSAPTKPTCAPCAVCIGGSAAACAVGCGISQFW